MIYKFGINSSFILNIIAIVTAILILFFFIIDGFLHTNEVKIGKRLVKRIAYIFGLLVPMYFCYSN
jgi:hypothetical protein